MTDLADLSPEKRALLEVLLEERAAAPQAFPLSSTQRGLWFLDQMEPGSPTYILPAALRMSGRLDPGVLRRALNEVVRRHEALRTTFAVREGEPVQLVAQRLEIALPEIDLSSKSEEEREAAVRSLAEEQARTAFDLAAGPLLRATLLRLGEEEHVLVFTMHHIVSDAWSMGVLVGEVSALYNAFSHGQPSPLPELELQYPDYVEWQQEWLESDEMRKQLAYWLERLAGAPGFELPTDRRRPAVQTWRIHRLETQAPAAVAERLRDLCRGHGATPFMALLAAFQTLVLRYTGQPDIILGSLIANRRYSELEKLIGLFVNTLALRGDLGGDPTFEELLGTTRQRTLEAYANQDLPFDRLVGELKLERDLSRAPLFQIIFQTTNTPAGSAAFSGLTLSTVELTSQQASDYDLVVNLTEMPQGLAGSFNYNADLYDASTVQRFADHYLRLLEAALEAPSRKLSGLTLLSAAERSQLLEDWNGAPAPAEPEEYRRLFEAQVERTPDAAALSWEDGSLSYADLNRRANRWAHHLRSLGVGPESLVALCVERSPEMLAGMLAVLKAGGAYVPLDPAYPAERLSLMLEDSQAALLLTQERLRERVEALAGRPERILFLDTDPESENEENPEGGTDPDLPAYVIYTSGSTGRPKGVVALNRGLASFTRAMGEILAIQPGDRFLEFPSFSFDASLVSIAPTLASGGTLVLHREPTALSTGELLAFCTEQRVNLLDIPVAFWRQVVAELASAESPAPGFGGAPVRALFTGGESLSKEAVEQWAALASRENGTGPETVFLSSYGPTETTVTASVFTVAARDVASLVQSNIPLGRVIPGVEVHLVDWDFNLVPAGVPGDLYVGGAGLTRGYLNRPDLTAASFVPDPISGRSGSRLYRTGDRARWLPGGVLEFLGRGDDQVKVRGFRVELGEIETALSRHEAVSQAAVLARDDLGAADDGARPLKGDRRLVAYVVPEAVADGNEPTSLTPDLRAHLRASLPEYMVPSLFVYLERMPLTPGGKVDRRALPRPDGSRPDLEHQYVAPRDAVEEAIAKIWMDLLGVNRVGIHDNFFELGGHSLLGTRVIAALRESFGVEVPLRSLFEKPTVADLALAVAQTRVETEDASEVDRLLANLENLSEEEVEALLAAEAAEESDGSR